MNVLFICLVNVNRSQFGEAFFVKYVSGHSASSAGVDVPLAYEGRLLKDVDDLPVEVMAELGIDLSDKRVKQLTQDMVEEADRIISFVDEKELPIYLSNSRKLEVWAMPDPGGRGVDRLRATRDDISKRVQDYVG